MTAHFPGRAAGALLLWLVTLGACGGQESSLRGVSLLAAMAEKETSEGSEGDAGFRFSTPPRRGSVTVDHQRRPVVSLPPGSWTWRGRVPPGGRLILGAAAVAETTPKELQLSVTIRQGDQEELLSEQSSDGSSWLDLEADLSSWAGQRVELTFTAEAPQAGEGVEIVWGPVVVSGRERWNQEKPNVLLIVIDTLRADHLSCYGYERPTTPRIDALLAKRGAVVEQAYAQAPWTLPSVISLVTGRYPTELLSEEVTGFELPPSEPSLGELLLQEGYETAAFYGNPALHEGTGFGRGFKTFFAPPAAFDWFERHADDLQHRLLPWVRAHKQQPFFLYAHYLDPHDPYDNDDVVDGRSVYGKDYQGEITGHQVHSVYGGTVDLADPQADVEQLRALYDSELTYVDKYVGELLEALGPEVLSNTLVILTSDHGEELFDHGGWKHGQSLYDEQIRVPFLVRWDDRVEAGRRLAGPVELLDVVPTVLAATGTEGEASYQGINLLPALAGEGPVPRRTAFSQHLSFGPLRAAAVLDGYKLVLFNRREAFEPMDDFQAYLNAKDLERFDDVELYDLRRDPNESRNLALEDPQRVRQMAPVIHRRLDRRLPGLRVLANALPLGSELVARFEFEAPPEGWQAYFLGPNEEVRLEDRVLEIHWREEPGAVPGRGIRIEGELPALRSLKATLDGRALLPEAFWLGQGRPYLRAAAGAVAPDSLVSRGWPTPPSAVGVRIWIPSDPVLSEPTEASDENRRRLETMGYLQP
ncbi:MAG: sulfatase [Deltaproteobacteria bacterium]|nr:sulfatase [Deltaproteobacteria bacterium]